jgi:hypothetical protein
MKTYTVYFSVPTEHRYTAEVKASSEEEAIAIVQAAFDEGTCPKNATPGEQFENYGDSTIQGAGEEEDE